MNNPFKKPPDPTVEELVVRQLDKAQKDLLDHQALKEYHTAMVSMLISRIDRLSKDSK